jgi:hypothetical protein
MCATSATIAQWDSRTTADMCKGTLIVFARSLLQGFVFETSAA